jgi:hypothetical protein
LLWGGFFSLRKIRMGLRGLDGEVGGVGVTAGGGYGVLFTIVGGVLSYNFFFSCVWVRGARHFCTEFSRYRIFAIWF